MSEETTTPEAAFRKYEADWIDQWDGIAQFPDRMAIFHAGWDAALRLATHKSPYEMTVAELQAEIGFLQSILHVKVLGDPRQGVTVSIPTRFEEIAAMYGWQS